MTNYDLTRWTTGEALWIQRRLLGETQEIAAMRCGMCEKQYWKAENDLLPLIKIGGRRARRYGDGDLCALARRRDGRSLRELATVLEAGSKVTLLAWEAASDERLVRAWAAQGYRF